MARPFRIKRGATLALFMNATTPLAGLTMLATVRDAEFNLVAQIVPILTTSSAFAALAALDPTLVAADGQALIYVADTAAWPEGLLRMDVSSTIPGSSNSVSPTIGIQVSRAVTEQTPEQADYNPVTSA